VAVAPLRDQALQAELAGLAEEVRADLAPLKIAHENAFRPPRQQPREIGLAKVRSRPRAPG
jgi:hypothetical protein